MLLSFKAKNYKSFRDEFELSMLRDPKIHQFRYSLIKKQINKKPYNALTTSVIYGPNAAGKTNVIGAMDTFRNIVLRGHIRNVKSESPNVAAYSLELISNRFLEELEPVCFAIEFVEEMYKIRYELNLDLGPFLDKQYKRRIQFESLTVNDRVLFERKLNHVELPYYEKNPLSLYAVCHGILETRVHLRVKR